MQDYSSTQPYHKTPKQSNGFFYILPLGLLFGFLLFVISFFVKGGKIDTFALETVTPTSPTPIDNTLPSLTPTPTEMPVTPTPVEEKNEVKENISIRVINGSGVGGVAGKMADELEGLGYDDIKTGNADVYTYKDITLRVSEEKKAAAETLKTELAKTHTVTITTTSDLPTGTDIEVIVGK